MPDVQEVYEMVTKQKPPGPGALERQQQRQMRTSRNRKVGAFVVAAAVVAGAVAVILATRPAENGTSPATAPRVEPTTPAEAQAVNVANGFLDAFGAFDAEGAMTYLAKDAEVSGLTGSKGIRSLPRLTAYWKAQGYHQTIRSCRSGAMGAADIIVVCAFDFDGIRSDEIGRGPFTGSDFTFTVRDGKIARVTQTFDVEKFSGQMWEPFAEWVSTKHPDDVLVMYVDRSQTEFRITERSIQLWAEYTRDYVNEVAGA